MPIVQEALDSATSSIVTENVSTNPRSIVLLESRHQKWPRYLQRLIATDLYHELVIWIVIFELFRRTSSAADRTKSFCINTVTGIAFDVRFQTPLPKVSAPSGL